jgi:hypothetical protein
VWALRVRSICGHERESSLTHNDSGGSRGRKLKIHSAVHPTGAITPATPATLTGTVEGTIPDGGTRMDLGATGSCSYCELEATTAGTGEVSIRWPEAADPSLQNNLDLYVYACPAPVRDLLGAPLNPQPAGACNADPLASATTDRGSVEDVTFPVQAGGVYEVRVVPFFVLAAETYTGCVGYSDGSASSAACGNPVPTNGGGGSITAAADPSDKDLDVTMLSTQVTCATFSDADESAELRGRGYLYKHGHDKQKVCFQARPDDNGSGSSDQFSITLYSVNDDGTCHIPVAPSDRGLGGVLDPLLPPPPVEPPLFHNGPKQLVCGGIRYFA